MHPKGYNECPLDSNTTSLKSLTKREPLFLMADPLSRAYLSLKEAPEDQEDVMTVLETRSPTEIEGEQVNNHATVSSER